MKIVKKKTEIKAPVSTLALPTKPNTPISDLGGYSLLIFGEPKVGKTSLLAEFPESLSFMWEPGGRALTMYQIELAEGKKGWAQFREYLGLLEKDRARFKTIAMDTIDIAYKACLKWVCDENGMDHPSDEGYGKGWDKVNGEFTAQIMRLLKLNRGVILVSHAAEKDIKTRLGEEYTKIVPTASGGARALCEALVDIWIYMYHDKDGQRTMRIRGNEHIAAGHRLQNNFVGIETIPAGKTAKTAYDNLVAAFNNKPINAGRPALRLAK